MEFVYEDLGYTKKVLPDVVLLDENIPHIHWYYYHLLKIMIK